MAKHGKRYRSAVEKIKLSESLSPHQAAAALKETASAKFDETIDAAVRLGVDAKKGEQMVRGTVALPHGSGKKVRVAVFARGERASDAEQAGADVVGAEDLVQRIDQGWKEFDVLVATRDMMPIVGRLGKKLGPRMPNPKSGTVAEDVAKVVRDLKGGRIEFRMDKAGIVHAPIGKASFPAEHLAENLSAFIGAVSRARPSSAKGQFIKRISISATMGPSIAVDPGLALESAER
jgi:large subunit ribosomal protein L1